MTAGPVESSCRAPAATDPGSIRKPSITRAHARRPLFEAQTRARHDGVLVLSGEGDVVYYNPRFQELWHIEIPVGLLRCDVDVWPKIMRQLEDPQAFLNTVEDLSRQPDETRTWHVRTRSGRIIECYTAGFEDVVTNRTGRLWGFRDITEGHQIIALAQQDDRLACIGQFACSIAQELGSLLTLMGMYTRLLAEGLPLDSAMQEHLREITHAAQQGRGLIHHLVQFAQTQPGPPRPVSLAALVLDALPLLRVAVRQRAEVQTELDATSVLVDADAASVHQMIMNVVLNAANAAQSPFGLVTVRTQLIEHAEIAAAPGNRDRRRMRLTVCANGRGSEGEEAAQVLDPDLLSGRGARSTGIGLSVVRALAQSHGGSVTIESQPGMGTSFHIDLPVSRGLAAVASARSELE